MKISIIISFIFLALLKYFRRDKIDMKLIGQGAEAKVYVKVNGSKKVIVKKRIRKDYRHPVLEKSLSMARLKHEARCLEKALSLNLNVPKVFNVNLIDLELEMEFIDTPKMKEFILNGSLSKEQTQQLFKTLGADVASLHNSGIIHGDLTTSNILVENAVKIVFIDFGLSRLNAVTEDKAVDLYVFERALLSTHPNTEDLFKVFLDAYKIHSNASKDKETVLDRLEKVQQRGRKKICLG